MQIEKNYYQEPLKPCLKGSLKVKDPCFTNKKSISFHPTANVVTDILSASDIRSIAGQLWYRKLNFTIFRTEAQKELMQNGLFDEYRKRKKQARYIRATVLSHANKASITPFRHPQIFFPGIFIFQKTSVESLLFQSKSIKTDPLHQFSKIEFSQNSPEIDRFNFVIYIITAQNNRGRENNVFPNIYRKSEG